MALGIIGAASLLFRPGQWAAALALILLSAGPAAHAAPARIADGKGLLRAMHARYQHDWYETLTFQQASVIHNPDGTSKTDATQTGSHWGST